jgi:hypothetical protein
LIFDFNNIKPMRPIFVCLACFLFTCFTLQAAGKPGKAAKKGGTTMAFEITSPAFKKNETIPEKYTCDGENVSPPLNWSNTPAGTKSFALICDDPDAPMGTFVHWVLYCIPASAKGLPEGVPKSKVLQDGSKHGATHFGRPGYGGPCPPAGKPHRYFFKVYALDAVPALDAGATKEQLLATMKGHILASAELVGLYSR